MKTPSSKDLSPLVNEIGHVPDCGCSRCRDLSPQAIPELTAEQCCRLMCEYCNSPDSYEPPVPAANHRLYFDGELLHRTKTNGYMLRCAAEPIRLAMSGGAK